MGKLFKGVLVGCCALVLSGTAHSTIITYEATNISGTTWEYAYTIENDTLGVAIEEFSIYFDPALYENLSLAVAPADWDPLLAPPNPFIPDDGFYDAYALITGIASGDTLGGFSVQFDYLGTDAPGSQFFDILDPLTFDILDSGVTRITNKTVVTEPSILLLLLTGLGLLGISRRTIK